MTPSTSRAGTRKCYAETRCSVSTPESFPSTPLHFVKCSLRQTWLQQSHLTVVPASCLRTRPRISRRFSRLYISRGSSLRLYALLGRSADRLGLCRFPEKNKVPDFVTFSSLLRITAKYELPAVRSQLLEVVRDGYPETFEGLVPSKPLGERIFSGRTPHPNEVLNLFVQQNLTSALPMAYYMAARRGLRSLMDTHRPAGARLPPEILRAAVEGLIALREMELKESHRLILGSSNSRTCFSPNCTSPKTMDPRGSDVRHEIVDRIVGSSQSGTKILQVLSLSDVCGGDNHGFCESCVEWWECGRAEVRKKAWDGLPGVFGLSRA